MDLVCNTIKRLHSKQQSSDEKIVGLKLELRNKYQMSRNWIENTLNWLQKKGMEKAKKKSPRLKFDKLLEVSEHPESQNPARKIIYNNSKKKLTSHQEKLLELGLNFAVTPKKFPLLEYIAAAEDLCLSLEGYGN